MVKFLDNRQKRTGWLLIVVAAAYLVWFLKVRLFSAGLPIEKKEWVYFASMIVILMLGTANLRLAMLRERRKAEQPNRKHV
jgi:hypothetical protein